MEKNSMKFKLTCKEAHRLVSEELDRNLSAAERIRLKMHLFTCNACRNFNGQMDLIRRAMRKLDPFNDPERNESEPPQ
jgi:predicted anti-sigma-YlaC factor YlaD